MGYGNELGDLEFRKNDCSNVEPSERDAGG